MNKELARYFFVLIDKDLQFSFNGMGLPNNACEWLENQLMQGNFDKVEEFIKLRYAEQNKKRIKKKHKFRAMTNSEFCNKHKDCYTCPEYKKGTMMNICSGYMHGVVTSMEPYRTTNGKYIAIEVKE